MKKILIFLILLVFCNEFVKAAGVTYYSTITGNYSNATLTQWKTNRDGTGSSPANFTGGDIFIVQGTALGQSGAPHTVTTSSSWSISGTGSKLQVEGGATLVQSSTLTVNAATTFQLDAGSFYTHGNSSGASISAGTESWNSTATITYTNTGVISSANITGNSHPNVVFNNGSNTNGSGSIVDVSGNPAIAGSLTIIQGK